MWAIPDQRRSSNFTNCSSIMKQELSYRGLTYTCWTSKQSHRHQNAENRVKGRFPSCRTQRNTCNVCTRKTQRKQRIESVACIAFFACVRCLFQFFWLCRKPCVLCVAYVVYDSLETACCRPMWHKAVYISLMSQWISSQTQHSKE